MSLSREDALRRASRLLPVAVARLLRYGLSYPRFWAGSARGRRASRRNPRTGAEHLLISALPKSGSTWLEKMLSDLSGYPALTLPEAVQFEIDHGGSHDYLLPSDLPMRLKGVACVLKTHAGGCERNATLLQHWGRPYVVLHRDLRDVAVSHVYYVRSTPWHPEYGEYRNKSVPDALVHFAETLLRPFADWVLSWKHRASCPLQYTLSYNRLLTDTPTEVRRIVNHLHLKVSPSHVIAVVQRHRFEATSGGRKPGQEDPRSFVRSGEVGNWRRHFTPRVSRAFDAVLG